MQLEHIETIEKRLWGAADTLRANSKKRNCAMWKGWSSWWTGPNSRPTTGA